MVKYISIILFSIAFFTVNTFAAKKEIALTIDDLPFVGSTHNKPGNLRRERERFNRMLQALIDAKIPATGFVIAGTIEKDQWELLANFKKHGFEIANHTYSHSNLNVTSSARYIRNIERADEVLKPLMTSPKFFRYPYLAEGRGRKKQEVIDYLNSKGYIIAPVTIDSKDFQFNQQLMRIYWRHRAKLVHGSIKKRYLNYIWRQTLRAERLSEQKLNRPGKQILLIHANLLNSLVLSDLIQMYKDRGYTFITLEEALKEPAYPIGETADNWSDIINDTVEKSSLQ